MPRLDQRDGAETPEGRRLSWRANTVGPVNLARAAVQHDLTLVHLSTEYTFDGVTVVHTEEESPSPLGVYGQSKRRGRCCQRLSPALPGAYLMGGRRRQELRQDDALPGGARCQPAGRGRPDRSSHLASDLAAGIIHLLASGAEFGTYNLSVESAGVSLRP